MESRKVNKFLHLAKNCYIVEMECIVTLLPIICHFLHLIANSECDKFESFDMNSVKMLRMILLKGE